MEYSYLRSHIDREKKKGLYGSIENQIDILKEYAEKKELTDTLKFAVVAFVILPFLPNQGYGPYGIFSVLKCHSIQL